MIRCLRMVDETVFGALMQNPFFDEPPRKSLHRQDFHQRQKSSKALPMPMRGLSPSRVRCAALALRHVPGHPLRR